MQSHHTDARPTPIHPKTGHRPVQGRGKLPHPIRPHPNSAPSMPAQTPQESAHRPHRPVLSKALLAGPGRLEMPPLAPSRTLRQGRRKHRTISHLKRCRKDTPRLRSPNPTRAPQDDAHTNGSGASSFIRHLPGECPSLLLLAVAAPAPDALTRPCRMIGRLRGARPHGIPGRVADGCKRPPTIANSHGRPPRSATGPFTPGRIRLAQPGRFH